MTSLLLSTVFKNTTTSHVLSGKNFQPGLTTIFFNRPGGSPDILGPSSSPVGNAKKLTGILKIPASTVPGKWNVVVATYDGRMTIKSKALQIIFWPPPTVGTITPISGTAGTPVTFNLTGTNFQADATAVIFNRTSVAIRYYQKKPAVN